MFGKLYLLSKSIMYAPILSVFTYLNRNKIIVPSAVAHPDTAICSKNLPSSELLSSSWSLLLTSNKSNSNNNIVSLSRSSKVKLIIKNIVTNKFKKDKHNDIYTTIYKNNIFNLDNKINYINNNNNINNINNNCNTKVKYQFNQTLIDFKKHLQNLELSKTIHNLNQSYSFPSVFKNIKRIL